MQELKILDKGTENVVKMHEKWKLLRNSSVNIAGNSNSITIGERCRFDGIKIIVSGDNNKLVVGNNVLLTGTISLLGDAHVEIGNNTTVGMCNFAAYKGRIRIGKYCMFARGIEIRTTDSHPIYDLRTKKRINSEADVFIDDYVWCGTRVTVVKGAHIAKSSIVALGSVVTKKFDPFCLIGGIPAKVLRRDVTWSRWTANEVLAEDKVASMYTADWNGEDPEATSLEPT